jgi:hypothetical protein
LQRGGQNAPGLEENHAKSQKDGGKSSSVVARGNEGHAHGYESERDKESDDVGAGKAGARRSFLQIWTCYHKILLCSTIRLPKIIAISSLMITRAKRKDLLLDVETIVSIVDVR